MKNTDHKYLSISLILLYSLLILERLYGIGFLRWAFDEEQNFGGGTAMLKWGMNLFGADIANPEMEHLVSIYGIVGKYLAVVPAAMGFALEKIFPIDLPIPLGLIFTRVFVSFLPSVLTIFLIHRIIRLVSDSKVFLFSTLMLFLFAFKHIETAHYGVSDGLSTFFVVLSTYYFLQFSIHEGGEKNNKYLMLTAIACMLAISTKINVGVIITATIGVFLLRNTWRTTLFQKNLGLFVFTSTAAFLVINLPYLIYFEEWYAELIRHIQEYPYTIKGTFLTPFYFHPPFGLSLAILLLALGGMWYGVLKSFGKKQWVSHGETVSQKTIASIFLPALLFLLLFYIYLAFSRGIIHRWAIPMTPFLVLFAGYFMEVSYQWALVRIPIIRHRLGGICMALIVFFMLGTESLYHVVQFDLGLMASPSTYEKLQNFVDEHIPANTCIYNVEGIQLSHCSENAPESIEALKESGIEYIVFSDFWFSERRYPSSILYLDVIDERTHGNWRLIRNHIEGNSDNWVLEEVIQPAHYSYWSTNIAQPPIFYIYKLVEPES
ncbi:MAG: phospholipid carrier-dependent glycosyltransferase [Chitinophagales bacterium]